MKATDWKQQLAPAVANMTDEEKERIIKTLSRIKRTKYLEYLINVFQPSHDLANKIRKYYSLPMERQEQKTE